MPDNGERALRREVLEAEAWELRRSTDLVDRLRAAHTVRKLMGDPFIEVPDTLLLQAANEIERLRKRLRRTRPPAHHPDGRLPYA